MRNMKKKRMPSKYLRINISLPPRIVEELDGLAKEAFTTRSGMISLLTLKAIQSGIKNEEGVIGHLKEVIGKH